MKTTMLLLALSIASVGCDGAGDNDPQGKYAPVSAPACKGSIETSELIDSPCVLCWGEKGATRVYDCSVSVCADGSRVPCATATARLCVDSIDACPLRAQVVE